TLGALTMSQQGKHSQDARLAGTDSQGAVWTLAVVLGVALVPVQAQEAPASRPPAAGLTAAPAPGVSPLVRPTVDAAGAAAAGPAAEAAAAAAPVIVVPPDVQVVRFQGPEGLAIEVLGPLPSPIPPGDHGGLLTVGLQRGVGYRLRIANIPERPGVELFPVIEAVRHLHRPEGIDPAKYPIRVGFTLDDLDPVLDQGRLVTKVIYLEDPDQALPFRMSKDQIPVVTLNPTEHPLRVAAALGRPMAIVRLGGRRPTVEEVDAGAGGDLGLDWAAGMGAAPCPFLRQDGTHCPMVAGPACTAAPAAPAPARLPRDEYLCDGGDRGIPATIGSDGRLGGIDPRDAVVRFDRGLGERVQPRVLPTNVVCVYAPRFAEVRVTTGTHETIDVQGPRAGIAIEAARIARSQAQPRRLVQNQAAEL